MKNERSNSHIVVSEDGIKYVSNQHLMGRRLSRRIWPKSWRKLLGTCRGSVFAQLMPLPDFTATEQAAEMIGIGKIASVWDSPRLFVQE